MPFDRRSSSSFAAPRPRGRRRGTRLVAAALAALGASAAHAGLDFVQVDSVSGTGTAFGEIQEGGGTTSYSVPIAVTSLDTAVVGGDAIAVGGSTASSEVEIVVSGQSPGTIGMIVRASAASDLGDNPEGLWAEGRGEATLDIVFTLPAAAAVDLHSTAAYADECAEFIYCAYGSVSLVGPGGTIYERNGSFGEFGVSFTGVLAAGTYTLHVSALAWYIDSGGSGQFGGSGTGGYQLSLEVAAPPAHNTTQGTWHDTIQAAIDLAADGDVIRIADGTHAGPGNVNLDTQGKAIVVESASGDPAACVIDGENQGVHGFSFHSGETSATIVRGIGIVNAHAGGMRMAGASPRIEHCRIENCQAFDGGGIWTDASPEFVGCVVRNCGAMNVGGGLFHSVGAASFVDCVFEANSAGDRGGNAFLYNARPSFESCQIADGSAASGGGASLFFQSDASFTDCQFVGNAVWSDGGGLFVDGSTPTLVRCDIAANTSEADGGGLRITNGLVWLFETTFDANESVHGRGGGMAVDGGGWAGLYRCSFTSNQADIAGALLVEAAGAFLESCLVHGNQGEIVAGATLVTGIPEAPGDFEAAACTFADNVVLVAEPGTAEAIRADGVAAVRFVNGIAWSQEVYADALPQFVAGPDAAIDVRFALVQGGWAGESVLDLDPLFAAPTIGDYALRPDSPAVNAGDDLWISSDTDLAGAPRIQQCRIDLGAYESPHIASDCNDDGIGDACNLAEDTFAIHDGAAEGGLGAAGPPIVFGVQHDAGAGDVIRAIAVAWRDDGGTAIGDPASVYLWHDPNGDGLPDDAVEIVRVEVVVGALNAGNGDEPDRLDVYAIPETVVSGSFFVGASRPTGLYQAPIDTTAPVDGRNFVNLGDDTAAFRAAFTTEDACADCAGNLVISTRRFADADANGVLDVCEAPACPADLDGSGAVDFGDVLAVLGAWGPCDACPEDLDASGAVDFGDLLLVLGAWGACG